MDAAKFERAILEMVYEGGAERLTAASVAYHLNVPFAEAEDGLERLLQQGVVELDSDDEGNLFYEIPNASAADLPKREPPRASRPSGSARPSAEPRTTTTTGAWTPGSGSPSPRPTASTTWGRPVEPDAYRQGALVHMTSEATRRRALVHAVASLLIPGVGQFVQGRVVPAFLFLFFAVFTTLAVPVTVFVHLWAAADAYKGITHRNLLE